ncbi:MAG: nicotinate-nucleotide adenylyltransferase [Phormidesmis sp. RL_2_1]|nr:nicotinate-nucleotide adenylyltransferase [Phormidesmis sp. RL_2_1]
MGLKNSPNAPAKTASNPFASTPFASNLFFLSLPLCPSPFSSLCPFPMQNTPWNQPIRVALFGTSADPPHAGHQSILNWLSQEFDQVAVWAAENPYKPKQSPLSDRAEMLRLLTHTLPASDKVNVYQSLSDRYSIHSIARARKIWPNGKFSLVVGADLVGQLPKWYRAKEIFEQVDILVFPRPGYSIQGPALAALQQQAHVTIAHPPHQYNIASSRYRTTECNQVPDDLPPVIRDYITERHLYPCLHTPQVQISTPR